ncbi:class I glutamine amidotransferase-like protein [Schizophyllum commune Tattone D]|nr:class I glutamine amidotransferase-like protein [Schizophyllum commune Tattone D]
MSAPTTHTPPRLALLLCDTPMPAVQREYGDYAQIFRDLLRNALPASKAGSDGDASPPFILDAFDVVHKMEYPKEEEMETYDAVLLTGSAASAYDDVPWINKLVDWVRHIAQDKPQIRIFGICFGHQIVGRALGGTCEPSGHWEVGPTPFRLTEVGKNVFGGKDELYLQQMHRDHVPAIPAGFELLGSTPVCPNQGMVQFYEGEGAATDPRRIHILTVQGHPEFTAEIVDKMVDARAASGVIPADTAKDYARRRAWTNDGVTVVGRVIWASLGVV